MCNEFIVLFVFSAAFIFAIGWVQITDYEEPPLIPIEDFFKNPQKESFKLSPNGDYLAFLQPWTNRMNLHVQKVGEDEVVRLTEATERDITRYFWLNNKCLAFLQDKRGDENFKLYVVDVDGSNLKELTPFENISVQMIDDLEDNEDEIIIGLNKRDKRIFDAYRINIRTGAMDMLAENPSNIIRWCTDNEGKLRMAVTADGVNTSVLYRKNESDKFRTVTTFNFRDKLLPLYFTFDNKYIYAASNLGRDKIAILKYDIANGKELEVIYQHPEVDVYSLFRSKKRKVITNVTFFVDKRQNYFFDNRMKNLQETLEKRLPGYEVVVSSMSKDEKKLVVRTYSDKSLGSYYFYNTTTKELKKLTDISPWLNEEHLADMKPIKYQSRDGLTIHGYLTLPKGVKPKNLPAIINPHGGPWARDCWGFNPQVQFLANRGYAVLQLNFRGSTGYGRKFWEISFKKWGREMQNDISDGVKWLVDEGLADPKCIGIYGISYGGYATLAGLAFTPELYACGVDYVGVSNLLTFMNSIPSYWEPLRKMQYEMVGNPDDEIEMMKAASPVFHVDKIKAPLFIAQGANDPRVNRNESDQMVESLKRKGTHVTYMVKENEGHGFQNEENRLDFYREMEKFLATHLKGKIIKEKEEN